MLKWLSMHVARMGLVAALQEAKEQETMAHAERATGGYAG